MLGNQTSKFGCPQLINPWLSFKSIVIINNNLKTIVKMNSRYDLIVF